ncbi:kinesin-like protein KIN-14S isoform X1 [Solanum dulcamara]|uniref:kinesin-like protein KIN-14S isoform X1 n=1 Tax=Solanum dulcamara TaxID=45834 RepID=UPI00248512D4|nr:kinesin-like protein KIN-14S isoform X1 [Solanum dulcamara]
MDDRTLEKLCDNFDQAVTISGDNLMEASPIPNGGEALESSPTVDRVKVDRTSDSVDESNASRCITEIRSSYQEQTLPILEKIEDSNEVLDLTKEQAALCNEVKGTSLDSFPGSEAFSALQHLSVQHELLEKRYDEECELLKQKYTEECVQHELLKKKYDEECELLKKKYLEECTERKRLYNEVIELKGNIRVFCRCRPLNAGEIADGSTSVVEFDPSHENELQISCAGSSKKQFKFDYVFKPEDSQDAVFAQTMPIVTSVLDGYNVCIFAYGQTGTGKTFTMEGTPENRGVNYRTLEKLFSLSSERSSIMKYELFVSMLEVYNEKIKDLLVENSNQPAKKLEIKQSAEGTQEVPGLVEARVYGTDEVWELLKSGSRARSVGSTSANELSSRSHCLLRVTVVGDNLINGQSTRSHLWLVDLAGSERVGRIAVEGERLKESQFINKSLSALGDVISALASKTSHIPYRNSKLTHMLQSSLGGDCKAVMFVQISPNNSDLGETLCSLNFASRVRGVEHGPARKQIDLAELMKHKLLAEKAKHDEKETKKLQDSLQSLQLRLATREQTCRSLQDKVRDLENQLADERKIRLKQESKALAGVSREFTNSSYLSQAQKITTEKKPPLAPSKALRLPLRKISNFVPPPPSPLARPPAKARKSFVSAASHDKENIERTSMTKAVLKPRRGSIVAVRPPPQGTNQVLQPKRRASIATLRPESSMSTFNNSAARPRNDRFIGRQSFVWDPQRMWRTSRMLSPIAQAKETSVATPVGATPISSRSSKFMGSPPSQAPGSWRPKHPTVVALKKQLVWSPLKKVARSSNRKSLYSS